MLDKEGGALGGKGITKPAQAKRRSWVFPIVFKWKLLWQNEEFSIRNRVAVCTYYTYVCICIYSIYYVRYTSLSKLKVICRNDCGSRKIVDSQRQRKREKHWNNGRKNMQEMLTIKWRRYCALTVYRGTYLPFVSNKTMRYMHIYARIWLKLSRCIWHTIYF